ncbi:MAG: hypothetical protein M0R66_02180 [Candidatus Omnitrophica bacterium]|nr:hypothetical protein [Candidatus Omnitrophota bacterium]
MNNLIGLAGKAGSGKDAVARILVEEYGYTRVAFADTVKRVLEDTDPIVDCVYGARLSDVLEDEDQDWDAVKRYPEVRRLLQNLGMAVREIDPEWWIKAAYLPNDGHSRIVVSDVRLPNEVHEIWKKQGVVYRVSRSGAGIGEHPTETALDGWMLPVIENDGTLDELEAKVREMMKCTP